LNKDIIKQFRNIVSHNYGSITDPCVCQIKTTAKVNEKVQHPINTEHEGIVICNESRAVEFRYIPGVYPRDVTGATT